MSLYSVYEPFLSGWVSVKATGVVFIDGSFECESESELEDAAEQVVKDALSKIADAEMDVEASGVDRDDDE